MIRLRFFLRLFTKKIAVAWLLHNAWTFWKERNQSMETNPKPRTEYGVTHTLEETAQLLGVTRERVRQIEKAALEKLRRHLKARYGITSLAEML